MTSAVAVYLDSYKVLFNWNDELEFLGFVLSEIVGLEGIEERGSSWHQFMDLPTVIDTQQNACSIPKGKLQKVLSRKPLKSFKAQLDRCRQVRNDMAHHQSLDENWLRVLLENKENLSS
jgi:hypothetical protein